MSRTVGALGLVVGLVGIGIVVWDLPGVRLEILLGGIAFAWGLALLTLPWDVHFQAVGVLRELDRSIARGLRPQVDRRQIVRLARRTLLVSLALHAGSAAAALGAAWWWSAWSTAGWLAAVYLGSTALRPIGAWYRHVREELRRSLGEVSFPRDDVQALRARVEALEELPRRLAALEERLEQASTSLAREDARLDRRLDAVGRRFEETLEHLTDNRELLAGIRAFLRMIRESGDQPERTP